jgi:hypothetical protein
LIRRVVRRKRAQTPVPAALEADGNSSLFANRIDQIHSWCDPDGQPEDNGRPESEQETP